LTAATPSDDYQRQRPTGPGIMSFGESSREGVTQAHPGSMRTWIPWHVACHGACHDCACHGGLSSDVLGAAAGGAHRMLFRIPLRMPFACHGPYYGPYYGACQCACKCACYRACNGPIRLIFELLTIYRVAEPADSKYYLLTGPCPDPWLADPAEPRVGIWHGVSAQTRRRLSDRADSAWSMLTFTFEICRWNEVP